MLLYLKSKPYFYRDQKRNVVISQYVIEYIVVEKVKVNWRVTLNVNTFSIQLTKSVWETIKKYVCVLSYNKENLHYYQH